MAGNHTCNQVEICLPLSSNYFYLLTSDCTLHLLEQVELFEYTRARQYPMGTDLLDSVKIALLILLPGNYVFSKTSNSVAKMEPSHFIIQFIPHNNFFPETTTPITYYIFTHTQFNLFLTDRKKNSKNFELITY